MHIMVSANDCLAHLNEWYISMKLARAPILSIAQFVLMSVILGHLLLIYQINDCLHYLKDFNFADTL